LRQWAAAVVDITNLQQETLTLWREEISMMLPETSGLGDGDDVNLEGVSPYLSRCGTLLRHFRRCSPTYIVENNIVHIPNIPTYHSDIEQKMLRRTAPCTVNSVAVPGNVE